MTAPYLGNPKRTIEVLQKYDFVFQKKYGQNFLIDTHVLDKIINAAQITKEDFVLEIGPGIGTMTQYLASRAREVFAVEIDKALIPILEDTLSEYENVTILNEDILKVDIRKLAEEHNQGRPIKVVANLPYYITTPIIMGLFEEHVPVESITVMVQKEVEVLVVDIGEDMLYKIQVYPQIQAAVVDLHMSIQHFMIQSSLLEINLCLFHREKTALEIQMMDI